MNYTVITCNVGRPREVSVWITLDGGRRSENLPLAAIHPDDVAQIRAADHWRTMQLRVRTDLATAKGLVASRDTATADLFGGGR